MESTGAELVNFWDFASSKGLMRKETADTMKSACKVVLSTVEPDTWESLDVTQIDADSFVQRFERLKMSELKPASLRVYGQRLRNGVATFKEFLASPTTWSYSSPESRAPGNGKAKKESNAGVRESRRESRTPGRTRYGGDEEMITYPYPVRPGVVGSLTLPADLTKVEATRLASFVSSLAMDPQLALPMGGETHSDRHDTPA